MDPQAQLAFAILISVLILVVALSNSTVGLAGGSVYLAVLTLIGMSPVVLKPTALVLNILVAVVGAFRFYRFGYFSWRTLWPFAITSIPASFVAASIRLSVPIYESIVGLVLLYSAAYLVFSGSSVEVRNANPIPILIALPLGAAIGLLAGFAGVGGGIFLRPVLHRMKWATTMESFGVTAAFILVNSIAGLLGNFSAVSFVSSDITFWAPAAFIGGWIGTEITIRNIPLPNIRRWFSAVLVVAALKAGGEAILPILHG